MRIGYFRKQRRCFRKLNRTLYSPTKAKESNWQAVCQSSSISSRSISGRRKISLGNKCGGEVEDAICWSICDFMSPSNWYVRANLSNQKYNNNIQAAGFHLKPWNHPLPTSQTIKYNPSSEPWTDGNLTTLVDKPGDTSPQPTPPANDMFTTQPDSPSHPFSHQQSLSLWLMGIHCPLFFFRLLPLSLRHFWRMSPSVLIRTRAVSDVEVAWSRMKTSVSLRRATCRGGHVEAVFFSPTVLPYTDTCWCYLWTWQCTTNKHLLCGSGLLTDMAASRMKWPWGSNCAVWKAQQLTWFHHSSYQHFSKKIVDLCLECKLSSRCSWCLW